MFEAASKITLTTDQLKDAHTVREKVRNLNRLGEQRWRYRVVEEGMSPRDSAIEILEKSVNYILVSAPSRRARQRACMIAPVLPSRDSLRRRSRCRNTSTYARRPNDEASCRPKLRSWEGSVPWTAAIVLLIIGARV